MIGVQMFPGVVALVTLEEDGGSLKPLDMLMMQSLHFKTATNLNA